VRTLVAAYPLTEADATRLVAYLMQRAEGNPFYAGEILRSLVEAGTLWLTGDGWALADLTQVPVPPLLRQVLDDRVGRLGEPAAQLLAIVAVIGQEVPLELWEQVAQVDDETLLTVIERSVAASLLAESQDGRGVRFVHALIREALYEGISAIRRRRLHLRAAETLADRADADPDAIAYHFQRAGDERAVTWLVRAGERAQRANAWLTAADRFETALGLLEARGAGASERGWLRYRLAVLRRFDNAAPSLALLEEAERLAVEAEDRVLGAFVQVLRGYLYCQAGEPLRGLPELEAGVDAVEALPREELARAEVQASVDWTIGRGTLAMHTATTGYLVKARRMAERFLATANQRALPHVPRAMYGDAYNSLGFAWSHLGDAEKAREAYERCIAIYRSLEHHTHVGNVLRQIVQHVLLPYRTEAVVERRQLIADAEAEWVRARGVRASLSPRISDLPLMVAEGRSWPEARDLAREVSTAQVSQLAVQQTGRGMLVILLDEQGEWEELRTLLTAWLPEGPETPFGSRPYAPMLTLQRAGAQMALATGELDTARRWIEAYDSSLAQSGGGRERSEGQTLWSQYYRATGDAVRALQHAEHALALATEPRQPRALILAHRLLGELCTAAARFDDAANHLRASADLAERCALYYQHALTLIALAELHAVLHERDAVLPLLDEARAILTPLEAKPALARAAILADRLAYRSSPVPTYPAGLTAREVEVLRLIAAGRSNREIAAALFISERTVNRHITNLYTKIDAHSKADATAYALRHHLA
jgi:DNA-binding CsgD family transcriptional regulator